MRYFIFLLLNVPVNCFFKKSNFKNAFDYNILDNLRKRSNDNYNIIEKRSNKVLNIEDFIKDNIEIKNKKVISISPGGLQGFYLMGIMTFIKKNYNLDNYIFTGASAGAWSCLFMAYKYNPDIFRNKILKINTSNVKSIFDLQLLYKKEIIKSFSINDFYLDKIFIGVTILKNLELSTNIFYNFNDLEDVIDCCIASSHIPFLTGGMINKYNNEITFDGGFSNYPYLDTNNTVLHINPNIWNPKRHTILDYGDLVQKINDVNFYDLYNNGYNDTKSNKVKLDSIFYN